MVWRLTKMAPKLERPTSRDARSTAKLFSGAIWTPPTPSASSVWMLSRPTFQLPTLPESRAPPKMSIGSAGRRQADAAAEEDVDLLRLAELEGRGVLEEERPLLREEQVEPRQVDLFLVDFHLREVGVDGDVEREVGTDSPLEVAADLELVVDLILGPQEVLVRRAERVGDHLDVAAGRHVEAGQLGGQRHAVDVPAARDRRQVDLLVLVADVAHAR